MNSTSRKTQPIHPPELTALAADLHAWRGQRSSRRTPIPDSLRDRAVALLDRCRRTHIIKALGINSAMLKTWQNQGATAPAHTAFVPLTLPSEPIPTDSSPMAVTIANQLGQQVTLQGGFSATQLALVVRALSEQTL